MLHGTYFVPPRARDLLVVLLLYIMMLWMYIPVLGVQLSHSESEPAHMLVLRVHLECHEHQLWRPGG